MLWRKTSASKSHRPRRHSRPRPRRHPPRNAPQSNHHPRAKRSASSAAKSGLHAGSDRHAASGRHAGNGRRAGNERNRPRRRIAPGDPRVTNARTHRGKSVNGKNHPGRRPNRSQSQNENRKSSLDRAWGSACGIRFSGRRINRPSGSRKARAPPKQSETSRARNRTRIGRATICTANAVDGTRKLAVTATLKKKAKCANPGSRRRSKHRS